MPEKIVAAINQKENLTAGGGKFILSNKDEEEEKILEDGQVNNFGGAAEEKRGRGRQEAYKLADFIGKVSSDFCLFFGNHSYLRRRLCGTRAVMQHISRIKVDGKGITSWF